MLCLPDDLHFAQVEVQEPEAYMYDGEYERKAAELNHPSLITIRESNVSAACLAHVSCHSACLCIPCSLFPFELSTCKNCLHVYSADTEVWSPVHKHPEK